MKILLVDRGLPIPALKYGGTERVIWSLGKELVKLGHEITYLVPKGSKCSFAKILEYIPEKCIKDQIPKEIDIVHFNFPVKEKIDVVNVTTLHGYLKDDLLDINTIFISEKHAERHNGNYYIHHGLDWDEYKDYSNQTKNYYHFLGKANWKVKNSVKAIDIAIKANEEIHILGGTKYNFRNFKRNFKNILNSRVFYHGMVGGNEKFKLMNESKGLIFPVRWHEPFGLAIIESLYYGCPVFGSKYGSLPEIISSDVGFLSNETDEIINALKTNNFSSKLCNEYVVDIFNSRKMAEKYLKAYEVVLNGRTLNKKIPKQINTEGAFDLLPFY